MEQQIKHFSKNGPSKGPVPATPQLRDYLSRQSCVDDLKLLKRPAALGVWYALHMRNLGRQEARQVSVFCLLVAL